VRRWRVPLLFSALVVLARLAPQSALIDVVSERASDGAHLDYPLSHIVLAPLTLLADWLNGGSTQDLKGFVVWAVVGYSLVHLWTAARPAGRRGSGVPWLRHITATAVLALFLAWAVWAPRPIPRLVVDAPDALVHDVHSHTSASHDGRHGFSASKNAAWHERAGFQAEFITDHNSFGAVGRPHPAGAAVDRTVAPRSPRMMKGEELSLFGLHLIVLGNDSLIPNAPWNASWDSSLALMRLLSSPGPCFLIASLPEYWRNHWGPDLQGLVSAGAMGFEIWTSSPKAMDIPPDARRHVIARARLSNLVVFGATDMHGLGFTASVWNVTSVPGWRGMDDRTLEARLIERWRAGGFAANRVIALRRWLPETRLGQAFAVPVNLLNLPRRATPWHALALLGWIWIGALFSRRSPRPTP